MGLVSGHEPYKLLCYFIIADNVGSCDGEGGVSLLIEPLHTVEYVLLWCMLARCGPNGNIGHM